MKKNNQYIKNVMKAGIFIVLAFVIIYSYPTQNKFKYTFEVGKPWGQGLVTAPFDFPIYKTDAQIETETAELLKDYIPFYELDTQMVEAMKNNLDQLLVTDEVNSYMVAQLEEVYTIGVMSATDYALLMEQGYERVALVDEQRMVTTVTTDALFTQKTAYEFIIQSAPKEYAEEIKSIGVNNYLIDNLSYDSDKSDMSRSEILKSLSLTEGIVQSGERIIDRGEVVSNTTYRLLVSLQKAYNENETTMRQSILTVVGESLLVCMVVFFLFLFIYLFRPAIFGNVQHLLLVAILVLLMVLLTSITVKFTDFSIYIIPFALLPIVIRVFFDSDIALFVHIISTVIIAFIPPVPFEFIILQMAVGITAVSSLKDMTQRSQLATTSLWIFGVYTVSYVAFHLIAEGDFSGIQWQPFVYFAVSSLLLLLAYALIYVFEKLFALTSSITLVELTNVNSDFMIEFSETAPGTFQHSLQVANLATAAAKRIGANSLLVRTGALYHDIGKMVNSHLFIENQQDKENLLLDMDLEEAARNVTNHVSEGVRIAKKKGLPSMVINFILTHHGTSKTKYFYNTFCNRYPEREVNEAAFTYPGPLPNTKETAILMMADVVEACSRTLPTYTEETINDMVERMIDGQILDGMFKLAPITFEDVEAVKQMFKDKIKSMYHNRILYPELDKKETADNS